MSLKTNGLTGACRLYYEELPGVWSEAGCSINCKCNIFVFDVALRCVACGKKRYLFYNLKYSLEIPKTEVDEFINKLWQ